MQVVSIVVGGGLALVASALIPALEAWGPYFALCAVGAAHVTWIIRREETQELAARGGGAST